MIRVDGYQIGIDSGSLTLFSDFDTGGKMWAETGPREVRNHVTFSELFLKPPVVQVSISMWDLDQRTNLRADISAQEIDEAGFDIVFRTWGDTRVARIRADWQALGAVTSLDDWTL